jgi:hypothetical protein
MKFITKQKDITDKKLNKMLHKTLSNVFPASKRFLNSPEKNALRNNTPGNRNIII